MSIINKLRLNASKVDKSIIFPDGNDERTIKAANELLSNKLCKVSLIGDRVIDADKAEFVSNYSICSRIEQTIGLSDEEIGRIFAN